MVNEIDPATVQRCIEVLRGKGEYKFHGSGLLGESWTYTTHPIDLLQTLLPEPEKSEAEKLVEQWWPHGTHPIGVIDFTDFVLKMTQPSLATPAPNPAEALRDIQFGDANMKSTPIIPTTGYAATVNTADPATTDSQPRYVFGPWIEWHGGECPVPDDWEVETVYRYESLKTHTTTITTAGYYNGSLFDNRGWEHKGAGVIGNTYDITQYRVRFEVGKWYDWAGGPCPVLPEQRVEFMQNDDWRDTLASFNISKEWWTWDCHSDDRIVRFRCVE